MISGLQMPKSKAEAAKESAICCDFPVFKIIGGYLTQGGRIEKRHNRICLVDNNGEYVVGGETLEEMVTNAIFVFC